MLGLMRPKIWSVKLWDVFFPMKVQIETTPALHWRSPTNLYYQNCWPISSDANSIDMDWLQEFGSFKIEEGKARSESWFSLTLQKFTIPCQDFVWMSEFLAPNSMDTLESERFEGPASLFDRKYLGAGSYKKAESIENYLM